MFYIIDSNSQTISGENLFRPQTDMLRISCPRLPCYRRDTRWRRRKGSWKKFARERHQRNRSGRNVGSTQEESLSERENQGEIKSHLWHRRFTPGI